MNNSELDEFGLKVLAILEQTGTSGEFVDQREVARRYKAGDRKFEIHHRVESECIDVDRPFVGLAVEWRTGGIEGGNYTPSSRNYSFTTDEGPLPLSSIDALIETAWPELTWLAGKRLMALVETHSRTEYGYYGNSTDYRSHRLSLENLRRWMAAEKLELPDVPAPAPGM